MYKNFFSKKPIKAIKDKQILDTSELLTEQDLKDIESIETIKKALFSYIDKDKLLKTLIEIIENSKFISFKNARSRQFIDRKRPSFNLVIDSKEAKISDKYKFNKEFFTNEKEEIEYLSNIVYYEIINKVTDYINKAVHANKDLEDFILSQEIFKDYELDSKGLDGLLQIITTIFAMRFQQDKKENVILEMFY